MAPTLRTLPAALELIKTDDPGTMVTLSTLRNLVKHGQVPVIKMGNRPLVNMDTLLAVLAAGTTATTVQATDTATTKDSVAADNASEYSSKAKKIHPVA